MTDQGAIQWPDLPALDFQGPLARRHKARLIGSGSRLVVFSHGLGTDQSAWDAIIERLPANICALVFDLPGAGPLLPAGFDPEDYSSIADYADDLLKLLDELGIERCTFVGHSVSGMIGVLASIEEPARFEQLVLLNASPRYLNSDGYVGASSPLSSTASSRPCRPITRRGSQALRRQRLAPTCQRRSWNFLRACWRCVLT